MEAGQIGAVGVHVMLPVQRIEQDHVQILNHLVKDWTALGKT